jgi:hypothetical protein
MNNILEFKEFEKVTALTESVIPHHKHALKFGYKSGTSVGTSGYFNKDGGFVHVYTHPKGDELHVHTKEGSVTKWGHVSPEGEVHRIGTTHEELHKHFTDFHKKENKPLPAPVKKKPKKRKESDFSVSFGKLTSNNPFLRIGKGLVSLLGKKK